MSLKKTKSDGKTKKITKKTELSVKRKKWQESENRQDKYTEKARKHKSLEKVGKMHKCWKE